MLVAIGPNESAKSALPYHATEPLRREDTEHRVAAWIMKVMCKRVPPMANAPNIERYIRRPTDEQKETYRINNPQTGILSENHDAFEEPLHRNE